MQASDKIYIAGHNGMVGSAILRNLKSKGFDNFVLRSSKELDLRNQQAVNNFFQAEQPMFVFLAAAKVGGILANNTYRADFIYDNILMEANIIHAAWKHQVKKMMFLGSSCIYPKNASQPLKEEYLLTGELEPTNEPYAIAKIAGIKLCDAYRAQHGCNFISVMPTNLYGPNDNYDLNNSHVLPALLSKFHTALINSEATVNVWGSGLPMREFMHVDDMADACVFLMEYYNEEGCINVGTGTDLTIMELALMIKKITGYSGEIVFDLSKPDGTIRKLLDVSKVHSLGWRHKIGLQEGIARVYENFIQNN